MPANAKDRPACKWCDQFFAWGPDGLCLRCAALKAAGRVPSQWVGIKADSDKALKFAGMTDRANDCPDQVTVETTPYCQAANEVFTPEELEARIVAHRERILRNWPKGQRIDHPDARNTLGATDS